MGIRFNKRGFSLSELYVVLFLSAMLMASITMVYHGGLESWDNGYKRYKMRRNLALTLERMSKDLKQARRVDEYSNKKDSLEFDILEQGVVKTYVYYLYSPDDNWPNPPWKASFYQLRKLDLAGGFVYGSGVLLLEDIESPKTPFISWIMQILTGTQAGIVRLDFRISSDAEVIHMRTEVKLRNVS